MLLVVMAVAAGTGKGTLLGAPDLWIRRPAYSRIFPGASHSGVVPEATSGMQGVMGSSKLCRLGMTAISNITRSMLHTSNQEGMSDLQGQAIHRQGIDHLVTVRHHHSGASSSSSTMETGIQRHSSVMTTVITGNSGGETTHSMSSCDLPQGRMDPDTWRNQTTTCVH